MLGSEGKAFPSFNIKIHVYIPAVMEHVELAGIHSGDTACVIPPVSIPQNNLDTIKEYTKKIAENLHVCGLMNMQYAIEDGKVYVIEANPRASRTVPLVSKVCDTQMARLATRMMLGESLGLKDKVIPYHGAKEGRTLSRAHRVYFVNSPVNMLVFAKQKLGKQPSGCDLPWSRPNPRTRNAFYW